MRSIAQKFNIGYQAQNAEDLATIVEMLLENPEKYKSILTNITIMRREVSSISINITKDIIDTIHFNRKEN